MFGLGTIINTAAIIVGGIFGLLFGGLITKQAQDTLQKTCGICTMFIAMAGAMEGMLVLDGIHLVSGRSMFLISSLALGALVGELLNIENGFERFGEWLKVKSGNAKDKQFVDGFVMSSLTVCIGAMAIIGSIQDGLLGDYSLLATKAVLDFIIIMVMTCSLGKGCIFSAIPVALFQGSITALSQLIKPIMTDAALENLSLVGSLLIFCVGINLVWGKKIRVANLLPAIVFAVAFAFLPFTL